MSEEWVCYLLQSVDSRKTYVGATNNLLRRLNDHNGMNGRYKGAKATRGEQWIVVLYVSGFSNKIGCLSFESGVRLMQRRKTTHQYIPISYKDSPIQKRIKSFYNLIHLGSPLKKWTPETLEINWLEKNYKDIVNL